MSNFQACYEYTCSIIRAHIKGTQGHTAGASPRTHGQLAQRCADDITRLLRELRTRAGPPLKKGEDPQGGGGHVNHRQPPNICD